MSEAPKPYESKGFKDEIERLRRKENGGFDTVGNFSKEVGDALSGKTNSRPALKEVRDIALSMLGIPPGTDPKEVAGLLNPTNDMTKYCRVVGNTLLLNRYFFALALEAYAMKLDRSQSRTGQSKAGPYLLQAIRMKKEFESENNTEE